MRVQNVTTLYGCQLIQTLNHVQLLNISWVDELVSDLCIQRKGEASVHIRWL